jgi:hypothetical protein
MRNIHFSKLWYISSAVILVTVSLLNGVAFADSFNANKIIDDYTLDNTSTMSAQDINNFLNQFANSCISPNSGFKSNDPTGYSPSAGYQYGGFVTSGQVIYDAAQAYGINPQVLITTLEKEQSLITGRNNFSGYCNNGDQHKYAAAVGYGCPDSGTTYSYSGLSLYQRNGVTISDTGTTCVNSASKAGFSQQVIRAAWLLKFGEQRSEGKINWAVIKGSWDNSDDPQTCYGGPMTQGSFQRCPSGGSSFYDGYSTIDSTAVHMDTGATAALYWYTPHFHGNQVFYTLFTGWFGSTISNYCLPTSQAAIITDVQFRKLQPHIASGNYIIYSGTQTNCVESHTWQTGFTSWQEHTVSNLPAIDPSVAGSMHYADLSGSGKDNPVLVDTLNTGSGMTEFHVWDYSMRNWVVHAVSNLPDNMSGVAINFAYMYGTHTETPVALGYSGTSSGMVELHTWNSGLQSWRQHIVTNLPVINPANMIIRFANILGGSDDTGVAIGYAGTATGMVEFHVWNPGYYSWNQHIVTNLPTSIVNNGSIQFADLNGDGRSEAIFVQTKNTTSGRIEFHVWNPGFTSWKEHIISNQQAL